jgi:hypothetical protein
MVRPAPAAEDDAIPLPRVHHSIEEASMHALMSRPTGLALEPGLQAANPAAALSAAGGEPVDKAESVCGWFESSWDLRHGLAVSELADSELALAALWFSGLAGRLLATGSACL